MGLKRLICLFVLLAACLAGLVWLTLPLREPRYLGQPLSFWLSGNWVSYTPMELAFIRDNKDAAIRQMGPAAVPTLVRWLQAHDSPLKLKLLTLLQKQPYFHFHCFTDVQQHRLASDGFVALGVSAQSAIPDVLEIAQNGPDNDSRLHAVFVLSYLGAPTERDLPALVRAATCANSPAAQRYALKCLGRIHAKSDLVVPALSSVLITSSDQTHGDALMALCQMPVEPRLAGPVVSAMIDVLRDRTTPPGLPTMAACVTLGKYGADAAPTIPALFEFLKSVPPEDSADRKVAVDAIRTIDPEAATARAAELEAALHGPPPSVPVGSGH